MGWGGAPLHHQAQQHVAALQQAPRFRPADDGYRGGRGGGPGARGARGPPPQHYQQQYMQAQRPQGPRQHPGDPRQKNQGYRRLWQQVTQARADRCARRLCRPRAAA